MLHISFKNAIEFLILQYKYLQFKLVLNLREFQMYTSLEYLKNLKQIC